LSGKTRCWHYLEIARRRKLRQDHHSQRRWNDVVGGLDPMSYKLRYIKRTFLVFLSLSLVGPGTSSRADTLYISGWLGFDASVAWPLTSLAVVPGITGHSPSLITAGITTNFILYGSNFNGSSVAFINGRNCATTFDAANPGQLTVTLAPTDVPNPGSYS